MLRRKLTIFVSHPSHFLTDSRPHGDGLIAYAYLTQLAKRGHNLHVACPLSCLSKPMHPNIRIYHIDCFAKPSERNPSFPHRLEYAVRVRQLFTKLRQSIKFDLIHQLNPVVWGISLFLSVTGVPLILGPVPPSWKCKEQRLGLKDRTTDFLRDRIRNAQLAKANAILIPTQASSLELPNREDIVSKTFLLNYGVDTSLFSPGERLASTEQRQQILFLANLTRRKGIFTLLDAFHVLALELQHVTLTIAGDGEAALEVKERIRRSPFSHRIHLVGQVSRQNAPEYFRRCTVYCLPSLDEPFGMSALEAMSCGKPVVATNTGGLGLLLKNAGAKLCEPSDSKGLSDALLIILRSTSLQMEMGFTNRSLVLKEYSWKSIIERLEEIYADIAGRQQKIYPDSGIDLGRSWQVDDV